MQLADSGSLFFTRPRLADYVPDAATLRRRASGIFDALVDGSLKVDIEAVIDLDRAAEAHRALETRTAIGKTVLAIDSSIT
jgi:NADPH2:quinone reductase